MDENEFFREATLRICGNLEIEKSMHSLILYLKDFIPVSRLYLQYYEEGLQSIRTIAYADEQSCKKLDQVTHLSKEAIELNRNIPADKDTFLITNPHKFPVSREMMKYHGKDGSSIIILALRYHSELPGLLILQSVGDKKFVEADVEFVHSLKEPLTIALSNALKHLEVHQLKDLLADDNRYLLNELRRFYGDEIVGANFGLKDIMHKISQVALLDSPVLLLGETGVGKDVIANAIHYSSSRSNGPFVSVNCGAIPDTLIDSELFGHEKGAFTGALAQKRGRFERANKGTIFLDEIGELPLQAQVRLLKVLQSKEIERVGGVKTIPLDIRIIAATNRNLEKMVQAHQFREDLWFRINVFPVWIPPLRERRADIPALLHHFISLKSRELKLAAVPTVLPGAIDLLMDYHWPGNVRELQNVIERALILNPKGPLTFKHMNLPINKDSDEIKNSIPESYNLDEVTARHIKKVLSKTDGKIHGEGGAADLLGINASTLRNRMNKLGIEYRKN
ncbi:MAG: AAA family ATPase [Calditrichaeota bacterium]|nr:MAG: AAA family ATPase [Calditrichota bacterium]MBL1207671.1 AAA family ATPase [Calditrichota bacterium]NOG47504.1 sigma 54-interacting transcriptional regulator [Calditrichota bacterium]